MVADRVGCAWNTVDKYIEEHPTVRRAWRAERQRVNDRARHNLVLEIEDGNIQVSKWWLEHMDPEFKPTQRQELTGGDGGPLTIEYVNDWREASGQ